MFYSLHLALSVWIYVSGDKGMKFANLRRPIAIAVTMASLNASSAFALVDGQAQPFACGQASATVINNPFEVGQRNLFNSKSVRLQNMGEGTSGVVISNLRNPTVLSDVVTNFCLLFNLQGDHVQLVKTLVVRFCFQPNSNSPDLVTIDMPLSQFRMKHYSEPELWECLIPVTRIWGHRQGQPNLRQMSFMLTKPGEATIGYVAWYVYRSDYNPGSLIMETTTCDVAQSCSSK